MTDTRLPEHFLTSPTLDGLTSDAFRVYVNGLMWSVTHGTDGLLPERSLRFLHPDGKRPEVAVELVAAGLWEHDDAGYHVPDFLRYQTPAEQVERSRAFTRERKRRQRDRECADDPDEDNLSVSRVTDRVTERVTAAVTSEDRTGQDRYVAVKGTNYGTFVGTQVEHEQSSDPAAVVACYACQTSNPAGSNECGYCHNTISGDGSPRLRAVTS